MKNLIIALFCITYAIPAISADDDCRDYCDVMARAGGVIMNAHQKGYPMQKMIGTYSGAGDTIDELIIVAYDSPRYSTEESQQIAIEEYREKVYLECVNVYKMNPPGRVAMTHSR
jgi:hypothetical protein